MLFILSKLFWIVTRPSTLLLLLAAVGLLLTLRRQGSRWGRRLLVAGIGGMAACAILPIGTWLLRPLEDRFLPPDPMPAHVDGIISLGGAIDLRESADRGTPQLQDSAGRMTAFVALARRYPEARLLFSGGNGKMVFTHPTEAEVARRFYADMGIDPRRVVFEGSSRNTHENALFSRRLVKPRTGERWLLVESAADLPRAVGCFRAVGWPVIGVPADYHTRRDSAGFLPGFLGGLELVDWAAHEWIGLIYYRLRGWTPSLLPGPR